MKFTPWKTLSSTVLVKYRKWNYVEDKVELPNGKLTTFQYIDYPGFSVIVAQDAADNLIVSTEYRYLMAGESLEFPAGMIEQGMTPLQTAHKEFAEEAGFQAESMEYVGKMFVSVGVVKGWAHVFFARGLTSIGNGREETEQIETQVMSPQAFDQAVQEGRVASSHVLGAWALVRAKVLK